MISDNLDLGTVKEHIRRLERNPDRKSSQRKDAFKLLLSLVQSSDSAKKKLVTERIRDFFADFPDLQENAINSIYDICEDQEQEIRMAGYSAITSISEVEPSWILRNVDVLVQLLQSDEDVEVKVVKKQLQKHVDINPRCTLRVLCDQCVWDTGSNMDTEEISLRTRLRGLVLQFLDEKLKGCILRVVKEKEVETIFLRGMIGTIPHASPSELQVIVKNILTQLPSLSNGPSESGNLVLLTLLRSARTHLLPTTSSSSNNSADLFNILSLASEITTPSTKPISRPLPSAPASMRQSKPQTSNSPPADPLTLLKFFSEENVMKRLPSGSEGFAIRLAEIVLGSFDSSSSLTSPVDARRKEAQRIFSDISASLIESLIKSLSYGSGQQVEAQFLLKMLKSIHQCHIPSNTLVLSNGDELGKWLSELQKILLMTGPRSVLKLALKDSTNGDATEEMEQIQGLIRRIQDDISPSKTTPSIKLDAPTPSKPSPKQVKSGQPQYQAALPRQPKQPPNRPRLFGEQNQEQQRRLLEEQRERTRAQSQGLSLKQSLPFNRNQGTVPTAPRGERRKLSGEKTDGKQAIESNLSLSVRGAAERTKDADSMDVDPVTMTVRADTENKSDVVAMDEDILEGEPGRMRKRKRGGISSNSIGTTMSREATSINGPNIKGTSTYKPSLLSRLSDKGKPDVGVITEKKTISNSTSYPMDSKSTSLVSRIGESSGVGANSSQSGILAANNEPPSLMSRLSSSTSLPSTYPPLDLNKANGGSDSYNVINISQPSGVALRRGLKKNTIESYTRDGEDEIKIRGAATVATSNPEGGLTNLSKFGISLVDRLQINIDTSSSLTGDGDGKGRRKRKLDRR